VGYVLTRSVDQPLNTVLLCRTRRTKSWRQTSGWSRCADTV